MFGQYKQLLYYGMSHEWDSKLYANHNIPEDCGIEITKPFYSNNNSQKIKCMENKQQYTVLHYPSTVRLILKHVFIIITEKNIVPMHCWMVKRLPDCEKQNLSKICMSYALYESLFIPFKEILSLSAQGCILWYHVICRHKLPQSYLHYPKVT